jgi:hypothetical protein
MPLAKVVTRETVSAIIAVSSTARRRSKQVN